MLRVPVYGKIDRPTVTLHGENDADNFPETSADKERFFANGYERRVLPKVGNFVPREAPDAIVITIRQLLSTKVDRGA